MKRKSDGKSTFFAMVSVVCVLLFIEWIIDASEPKCSKAGCNNKAAEGSSYCYLHKPYSSSSFYKSNSSKKSSTATKSPSLI